MKTNMDVRYGWGQSDQRVAELVPDGYRKTKALTLTIDCIPRRVLMVTSGIASYSCVWHIRFDWLLMLAFRPIVILIMGNL